MILSSPDEMSELVNFFEVLIEIDNDLKLKRILVTLD